MHASNFSKFREQILPHLEIAANELKIVQAYVGQVGHLVLSPKEFVENGDSIDNLEELVNFDASSVEYDASKLLTDYMAAIAANPHIFDLKEDAKVEVLRGEQIYFRQSIYFEEPLAFTIKVPSAKKRFFLSDDGAEHFEVMTLGSPYIAFAEIDDCPKRIFIAHEFREQMRQMLAQSAETFHLGQVGPAPIHPHFYVLNVLNEEFNEPTFYSHDEDVYIVVNLVKAGMSINEIFNSLLYSSATELDEFFALQKSSSYLLDVHVAANKKLLSIVQEYKNLNLNPFFIDFRKMSRLRKDLLSIHVSNIEAESAITQYEQRRKSMLSGLESSMFFDDLAPYFKHMTEMDITMAPSFFRTMEYMEKSISAGDLAIRTIFAAIVGATIGMLVTILFK